MVTTTSERGIDGVVYQVKRPLLHPKAPRSVHIDPSLTGDATGFCMAHIGGWKDVERRSDTLSAPFFERAPIYVVDVILQIVPPPGDEIVLAEIRSLIYELNSHGYTITNVTVDSYQCFTGDTKVRLLDGRSVSFEDLSTEFSDGRDFWVYSFDGHRIVPGRARNPRRTAKKQVVEVELDNGERVRCTADHLWMLRDGSWCEAGSLAPDMSLMPLYMGKNHKVVMVRPAGEEWVYDLTVDKYANFALDAGVFVHNSADSLQQLNAKGFNAEVLSIDRTTLPYENLKTAFYEGRVVLYDYPILLAELRALERVQEGKHIKIDHPPKGSKDCSDALAGALFTLSQHQAVTPMPILRGGSSDQDPWMPEQRRAAGGGNPNAGRNTTVFNGPFFFGSGGGNDEGGGGGWTPL